MDDIKRKIFKEMKTSQTSSNAEIFASEGGHRAILYVAENSFAPPADVLETETEVYIVMEIGGLKLSDFKITYDSGYLIIEGERQEDKKLLNLPIIQYHKKEVDYGTFKVKIKMNCRIVDDKISANYKDGMLIVVLQKDSETLPRDKKIITVKKL